jgi:hypothetical protein
VTERGSGSQSAPSAPRRAGPRLSRTRTVLVRLLGVGAVAGVLWFALLFRALGNEVVVRNATGAEVTDLRVRVRTFRGDDLLVDESRDRVGPGDDVRGRFSRTDARTEIRWTSDGSEHTWEDPYVDLWAGEPRRYDLGPAGAVAATSEFGEHADADLRFVGTVTGIGLRRPPDPGRRFNWVVTTRVEQVLAGAYDGDTFAFVVHSPHQERLREGLRCVIDANRTSGREFTFVAAKPAGE